jgi:hypothetical protein
MTEWVLWLLLVAVTGAAFFVGRADAMTDPKPVSELDRLRDIIDRAFAYVPPLPSGSEVVWTAEEEARNRLLMEMIDVRHQIRERGRA